MIYNFNLGIGWASSGVEYAQLYRARMLRALAIPARFIFTDMFPQENVEHYTKNMGFKDENKMMLNTDFYVACELRNRLNQSMCFFFIRHYEFSQNFTIPVIVTDTDNPKLSFC